MVERTPCWVMIDCARNDSGYACCETRRFGKRIKTRHRLAWIDAHECLPPPETPLVLHHCDNPPCENPAHLYAGTPSLNVGDCIKRGRRRHADPQFARPTAPWGVIEFRRRDIHPAYWHAIDW